MITIRLARKEELNKIWSMVCRAIRHMNELGNPQWGEDYPTQAFYEGDIQRDELWVACGEDGALLGVACVNQEESPEYEAIPWSVPGPAMVVHRMAVDPTAQRQGLGDSFFAHAEKLARTQGVKTMRLDTYGQNERMQKLVLKRGYQQRGSISLHGRPLRYPCFEKLLDSD